MCSNCEAFEGCNCTGGSTFASCLCDQGEHCSACGHDPGTNTASQTDLLMISDPDLAVDFVEFE
jgi:hypothetical protein